MPDKPPPPGTGALTGTSSKEVETSAGPAVRFMVGLMGGGATASDAQQVVVRRGGDRVGVGLNFDFRRPMR
jgi:hypothetical protein